MNFPQLIEYYYNAVSQDNVKRQIEIETQLQRILCNPIGIEQYSYNNGYIGLGIGVLYILRKKIKDSELDYILLDVDKMIIRIIDNRPNIGPSLDTGILGIVLYLFCRLIDNLNKGTNSILDLKERAIYLLDWIEDTFDSFNKTELYICLLLYSSINIYNHKVHELIHRIRN